MSQRLMAVVLSMAVLSVTYVYARDSKAESMVADLLGRTNVPAEVPAVEEALTSAPPPAAEETPPTFTSPSIPEEQTPAAPVVEEAAPVAPVVEEAPPALAPPPVVEEAATTTAPPPVVEEAAPAAPPSVEEALPALAPPPVAEEVAPAAEEEVTVEALEGAVTGPVEDVTVEEVAAEREEEPATLNAGTVVGRVTDHRGRPLPGVKMVLFNDESYREMQSTPRGNFGFSITNSAEYTLTATLENQFYFTNLFLEPEQGALVQVRFRMPITIYGQLSIDGEPAQQGLFLRCINAQGGQAGGIVESNGYFTIKNITPGNYTMVFERRKRFIDNRINENRFYYIPVTLTSDTARITVERDRRRVMGHVIIDGLPRRHVDAVIVLKDAKTKGRLIHREMYSYYQEGYFVFEHVPPGAYTLQATQSQREWKSSEIPVYVGMRDRIVRVTMDISPDPDRHAKELLDLRRHFTSE